MKKSLALILALVTVLCMALAGCGGNTTGASQMTICVGPYPDTVDPALNSAVDGATYVIHAFAGLVGYEQAEDGSLKLVADCAKELPTAQPTADGKVSYTYELKDGLKWSDGSDLTAADFVYAWNRAVAPATAADYGYMFDVVKGYEEGAIDVTATDDRTLVVTLNNYVAYWNELLAFPTYMPVREDVVANEGWATDASTYVSNGAYSMTGWDHSSVITLTKNENYWNAENVSMNEIKLYLSDDDNTILTNWKSDTWMVIDSMPTNDIPAIQAEFGPTGEYIVGSQLGTYYACWNINEPLLP